MKELNDSYTHKSPLFFNNLILLDKYYDWSNNFSFDGHLISYTSEFLLSLLILVV